METQKHVVLFTHNEHSHIVPMLAMAQLLGRRGLRVTVAIPSSKYAAYSRAPSSSNQSDPSDALFQVEPVEESAQHASDDVMLLHLKLKDGLMQRMQRLQPPPSFLVADLMYFTWGKGVADLVGARFFLFVPFFATAVLLGIYIPELLQKGFLPFQPDMGDKVIEFLPGLMKGFRLRDMPLEYLRHSSAELQGLNFLHHCKASSGLVLGHTSDVIPAEREALNALRSLGLHVYAVAPMLQMDSFSKTTVLWPEDETCKNWLDEQSISSVVYVSFGSIISLTREDVQELALGLEARGQPFLWVVRRIEGCSDVQSALPPGFQERTGRRCCIVAWAPQIAVLSHRSVGCFITHCGCASVLEAIFAEVPMIGCFHKMSDQNMMSRVLADECRVVLPSMQAASHKVFGLRNSIEAAIKEVLHGRQVGATIKQQVVRLKAALQQATAPNGSSRQDLNKFVESLLS